MSDVSLNSYVNPHAFERLMVLIATLVQHPGIGGRDPECEKPGEHDAAQAILSEMEQVAQSLQITLPVYSVHTIRKDLRTLRRYKILDDRMYRWGYYLGTGALTHEELQAGLQALATQAQYQGDPRIRRLYESLERRLRGLNLELNGQLFYPVRTHFSRTIVFTDPEDMMTQGHYRRTLFHELETVERAIAQGQALEVLRHRDPHGSMGTGYLQIYPLQLIYSDVAWYLLFEQVQSQHFELARVDRLSEQVKVLDVVGRGTAAQTHSLEAAHQLLKQGWGLYLGTPEEQQQERAGQSEFVPVKVRFWYPMAEFILEGDRRHPTQTVKKGHHGGEPHVDFSVNLPERSLQEFGRWVNRFMHLAKILAPDTLANNHLQNALALASRYENQRYKAKIET
ncbi:MAG: WYL domain-containing protein [Tildeniella torsiva UHER 1998/13D]|jgi:predicted DNA-binding transcriptional regulator YafY|nr:WYL domain-containing protein [Tildeniella torsiva UHER 1998/13D]